MTNVHPGAFRVKIQPLSEEPNGPESVTPLSDFGKSASGPKARRGLVVEVGPGIIEDNEDQERWGFLQENVVVYYKGGYSIGGYLFVECTMDTIIAHESE